MSSKIALNKTSGGQMILEPEDGATTETIVIPKAGVGKVLQQVIWEQNTPQTSVNGAYTTLAGASQTFTPVADNSIIHVEFVFHAYVYPSAGAWESLSGRILVDGNVITLPASVWNYGSGQYSTTAGIRQMDYVFLAGKYNITSTSPIIVEGQIYSYQGDGAQANQYGTGYLKVTEIGA